MDTKLGKVRNLLTPGNVITRGMRKTKWKLTREFKMKQSNKQNPISREMKGGEIPDL